MRLHRDAMRAILFQIAGGQLEPGQMLPREVDLAAQFDISRGVARETLRALEERGVIAVKHGKGATIIEESGWDMFDPDVLAATLSSGSGYRILSEYLECRLILEVEAAGLAAERATPEEVDRMAAALQLMETTAGDSSGPRAASAEQRFLEADVGFHQSIAAATSNRPLSGLLERIHGALLVARQPLARPQDRLEITLPEHRKIMDAITHHDGAAARTAMSDHIQSIQAHLSSEFYPNPKGA